MWSKPPNASICDSIAALDEGAGVAACGAVLADAEAEGLAPFLPWATARFADAASIATTSKQLQRVFILFLHTPQVWIVTLLNVYSVLLPQLASNVQSVKLKP